MSGEPCSPFLFYAWVNSYDNRLDGNWGDIKNVIKWLFPSSLYIVWFLKCFVLEEQYIGRKTDIK